MVEIYEKDFYLVSQPWGGGNSYQGTCTIVELNGEILTIVVPFGSGYDCESGHYTGHYTEEEFLKEYKWESE